MPQASLFCQSRHLNEIHSSPAPGSANRHGSYTCAADTRGVSTHRKQRRQFLGNLLAGKSRERPVTAHARSLAMSAAAGGAGKPTAGLRRLADAVRRAVEEHRLLPADRATVVACVSGGCDSVSPLRSSARFPALIITVVLCIWRSASIPRSAL